MVLTNKTNIPPKQQHSKGALNSFTTSKGEPRFEIEPQHFLAINFLSDWPPVFLDHEYRLDADGTPQKSRAGSLADLADWRASSGERRPSSTYTRVAL